MRERWTERGGGGESGIAARKREDRSWRWMGGGGDCVVMGFTYPHRLLELVVVCLRITLHLR